MLIHGKEKRAELFDKAINDYIFHNSYKKNIVTSQFFDGILYKYLKFLYKFFVNNTTKLSTCQFATEPFNLSI